MRRQLKKSKSKKEAHEALLDRVSTVEAQMAVQHQAYQAELQSIQFQQALQTSTPGSQQSIVDDSTVSDLTTEFQNMKMAFNSMTCNPGACPTLPTSSISTPSSTWESHHQQTERMQRYEACKKLLPDCHKDVNEGKGLCWDKYCYKCGCNCTHVTRGCLGLTPEEKDRFKSATFENRMGGSSQYLTRRGKYQSEFNFDAI